MSVIHVGYHGDHIPNNESHLKKPSKALMFQCRYPESCFLFQREAMDLLKI